MTYDAKYCANAKIISLEKLEDKGCGTPLPPGLRRTGMEFHISREARDKYGIDENLFESMGNIIFPNFAAVQRFVQQLNDVAARAGEVNAMGLIDEIFHYVVTLYIKKKNPQVVSHAIEFIGKSLPEKDIETALRLFAQEFPPRQLYRGQCTLDDYMEGSTGGVSNRHLLLEELMILWVTTVNPAVEGYRKALFDDTRLKKETAYLDLVKELEAFLKHQPPFGPDNQDLLTMLRAPAQEVPDSLPGQLSFIRERWGLLLGDFMSRLLTGLDLIKEEEKFGGLGPGETPVYDFSDTSLYEEYERFSPDHDWMPRLVLMAKSTHVWLDQLSKKYDRHISRLDQVPDEELDELGNRGFTGLWLIGVWERSRASRRIKQMCGNPEAMASAYSIFEYRVADELGGDDALNNLKHRAWQRGIRMASDMVPNHMGIDSPWLVEHPEWFLSLDHPPYPAYTFNGADLSSDDRVSIFLEDHYYDRTDAAVVFKWVNNHTGETRYIYHGNDGTSMPWNDTAQLDYLNPEVREAVMGTIFSVASRFPIIRFDAAMTLAKLHYQRLWYPEPGAGGDIPSRAGRGLNKQDFNKALPEEFWRQVVDRFTGAQSDTLLLAEAFWLMEAYFVRTLGMHRVYNSAFMNFLKNEDNAQFRTSIKNVLLFNPQILKRFVNFMNNPDEESAVAQFGNGDKYIGVCSLMATLPGLPMFGHGQIEGYEEKYGMEYRCAYWDETPDEELIRRHEREIFPLLCKRYVFAGVEEFLLYDFYTPEGWVNEDVIAYSNCFAGERILVVYHNKFAETAGWIKVSVPYTAKTPGGEVQQTKSLGEGLALSRGEQFYTIFKDQSSGLEYIRHSGEIHDNGIYVELEAYKRNVFLDFRQVEDDERRLYGKLTAMLNGRGVPDIDATIRRHFNNPLLEPFQALMNPEIYREMQTIMKGTTGVLTDSRVEELEVKLEAFLAGVRSVSDGAGDPKEVAAAVRMELDNLLQLPAIIKSFRRDAAPSVRDALQRLQIFIGQDEFAEPIMCTWLLLRRLGEVMLENDPVQVWHLLEDWLLTEKISNLFQLVGAFPEQSKKELQVLRVILHYPGLMEMKESKKEKPKGKGKVVKSKVPGTAAFEKTARAFLEDADVLSLLGVNRHEGIRWFHKESADQVLGWLYAVSLLDGLLSSPVKVTPATTAMITRRFQCFQRLQKLAADSGYQLDKWLESLVPASAQAPSL